MLEWGRKGSSWVVKVGVGKDGVAFGGVQIRGWVRSDERSWGLGSKRLELGS